MQWFLIFTRASGSFHSKKVIGKEVNVLIDYVQPANAGFPEKVCCTVKIDGINLAEALISKGES